MKSKDSNGSGRHSGRGPRRSSRSRTERSESHAPQAPQKQTFWQKLVSFFKPQTPSANGSRQAATAVARNGSRPVRKPEAVEVTSPKLYIGNLSYDATESDLFDLFKGVGSVKTAEIVSHKYNEKSKGFGFVTMMTIDEAKRAVHELHDKDFMGRKLVVSGARSSDREPNYRG